MLATNSWQLPYEYCKIGPIFILKICIYFIIELNALNFEVSWSEFWGLVYAKWDMLDMTM